MMLLLDTCALIWWLQDDQQLSKRARHSITQAPFGALSISSATLHEMAIKASKGTLTLPPAHDMQKALEASDIRILPITTRSLERYVEFATIEHKDPFDRMIAAQALEHGAAVITCDLQFHQFNVELVWF